MYVMNGTIGLLALIALQGQVGLPTSPNFEIGSPREVGWMLDKQDGKLVYIIQISQLEAKTMQEQRLENVSSIPKQLQGKFDKVAIRIGTSELPREPSLAEIMNLPSYSTAKDVSDALNDRGPGRIATLEPNRDVVNVQNSQPSLPSLDGFGARTRDSLSNLGQQARDSLGNSIDAAARAGRNATNELMGTGRGNGTGYGGADSNSARDSYLSTARGGLPGTGNSNTSGLPSTSSKYNDTGNTASQWERSRQGATRLADSRFDIPGTSQPTRDQRDTSNQQAVSLSDAPSLAGGNYNIGNNAQAQQQRGPLTNKFGATPGARQNDQSSRQQQGGYGNEGYARESYGLNGYGAGGYANENSSQRRGNNNQRNRNNQGGRGYGGSGYGGSGYGSSGYGGGGYGGGNYANNARNNQLRQNLLQASYDPLLASRLGLATPALLNANGLQVNPYLQASYGMNGLQPGPFSNGYGMYNGNNPQKEEKKELTAEDLSPELRKTLDAVAAKSASDEKEKEKAEEAERRKQEEIAKANSGLSRTGNVLVQMFFLVSLVANCYLVYLIRKLLVRYRSLLSTVRSHAIA